VYIAAKGLTAAPEIKDKLVDGSRTMEIEQVETIAPGRETIVYILKVEN
jgi:hypothetical protein